MHVGNHLSCHCCWPDCIPRTTQRQETQSQRSDPRHQELQDQCQDRESGSVMGNRQYFWSVEGHGKELSYWADIESPKSLLLHELERIRTGVYICLLQSILIHN